MKQVTCVLYFLHRRPAILQNVYRMSSTTANATKEPKPFSMIPGLSKIPVLGSLHHFLPVIGKIGPNKNFFTMSQILHKKFGPVVKLDGIFSRASMVILYEPELYDQVYRAEDVLPLRPGFDALVYNREHLRKERFDGVYGLTIAQGKEWRDFRTKVNPALLKPQLVKLYEPALDEIAKEMIARLHKLKDDPNYLQQNLDVEINKWSLESIALVGLGARIGCMKDNLPDDHPGTQLINCSKDILNLAFKLEFFPKFLKRRQTPTLKKLTRTLDTQWEISEKFINQAKQSINERGHDVPEEDKSIIEKLLAIDERVAVMMANEMLFAGIDTVALTVIALLYNLARNPAVQNKLREEIRSGQHNKKYLKACIKESLRLHPVVAANSRRTSRDHAVAGYQIPKGIDVLAPNEYLSKSEKYFPRPTEFIPERWFANKTDPLYYGNAHPMVTLPFGFGIRSCIGRRIAELEIEVFMQGLVQEFQIGWDGPPLKVVTYILNSFTKPYHFKFESI